MTKKKILVAIADDQKLFLQGIRELLDKDEGIKVLFTAQNGKQLLDQLEKRDLNNQALPDVVLMDLKMPGMDGIQATRAIYKEYERIRVIIISMYDNDTIIYNSIQSGASGFLAKNADIDEVVNSIYQVHEKRFYFDKKSSEEVEGMVKKLRRSHRKIIPVDDIPLNHCEKEIVKLICEQLSTKEIAERLKMSPRTIESYKPELLRKTGSRNTAGLVLYALTHNLINHLFPGSKHT